MQALKVLALAALPAAAVATLVSVAISAFDVSILGNCDSKLGCWGGIQVGAVLAIVVGAACGLTVGCFALVFQALAARTIAPRTVGLLAAGTGLAVGAFFTSHIWGRA